MNRRFFLLTFLACVLIFTGLITVTGPLVALAIPLVLYLLGGLLLTPEDTHLAFERRLSAGRAAIGQPVIMTVTVRNLGSRLENVLIEDRLPSRIRVVDGSARHLLNLSRGESRTWQYTFTGQRGLFAFSTIHAEASDRFGLVRIRRQFPTEGQLMVLPHIVKLKRVSIRPRKTRVYSGEIPARSGGLGVEFFGVRDFQPGDSPNWINWRASARHATRLFSNEFEQERVSDVGIILDGREKSNSIASGQSIFEYSVLATATLANAFIAQGNRVSLLHYGKYLQWTFPGYGKIQRERILRDLSQAEPGKSLVFEYLHFLPIRIFPPQSQIVLISPLLPEDPGILLQMRARGYRVLVVSPDPVAFERSNLPEDPNTDLAARILHLERKLLLRRLLQGGIRVIDWDVAQPFDQVVQSLSRFPTINRSAVQAP